MADVSGPCSTLPGSRSTPPAGMECDNHPGVPATRRIQGETDSFGAEFLDVCDQCFAAITKEMQAERTGVCDWCKKEANDLRPRRDFEEGSCGPVYDVCGACVLRELKSLAAEAEEMGYYGDSYDEYWGDDL